jgi:tetratricopeptide (TPR) repeat protein
MPVKAVKIDSFSSRAILLAAAFVLLAGAFFSVRWTLANTAASKAEFKEIADLTISWAPDDPKTHYISAVLHERTFLPEDLPVSLSEYEKAAALAPHNFLLWLELGKARERNGDAAGAERTLRKALELAPNYAQVHWALGNNLLRQGRSDEAFAEIRQAVSSDPKYINPAAAMAWQVFDGDINLIRHTIGDSPSINAALSALLVSQKRFDEAFAIWESLTQDEKRSTYKETSTHLYGHLVAAKKYREALAVFSSVFTGEGEEAAAGSISNGGFENAIKPQNAQIFEWQITDALKPQIGLDTAQKHSGLRSLVLIFNSGDGKDYRAVSQYVVVEPGKNYQFELFYRSDLKTAATLKWEIAGLTDGKILGSTEPVAESADWTSQRVKFTVPANTEAVAVRLVRVACGAGLCPITGRIWFDDFTLSAE